MTNEPWSVRPQQSHGDSRPEPIFLAVGYALTLWETIETEISISYIGLIRAVDYRTDKYFATHSFAQRHRLVTQAIDENVCGKDCAGFREFIDLVRNYSLRRHEIAHGRVFNLGELGFYLGPNNTLSRNYPDRVASYLYTSRDINYFCDRFNSLAESAKSFTKRLANFPI